MHRNLKAEMTRQGVSVGQIAELLEVRYGTASDKINGKFRFYYDEALTIKKRLFPHCSLEYLFEKQEDKSA